MKLVMRMRRMRRRMRMLLGLETPLTTAVLVQLALLGG
jgi:hypothetical protein